MLLLTPKCQVVKLKRVNKVIGSFEVNIMRSEIANSQIKDTAS